MVRTGPVVAGAMVLAAVLGAAAQTPSLWVPRDHPAIQYAARPATDAIETLNAQLQGGARTLRSETAGSGYLASVLNALDIPSSSQILVFSDNSLQRDHISMATPRAIYFNDTVAIGWAKGAATIEATAHDATQGVHFYSISQQPPRDPLFIRRNDCLQCHLLPQTRGVPGIVTMSMLPLSDNPNEYAQGWEMDHTTPIEDRWGGWYVTGAEVPARHLGNVAVRHVPKSYVRAAVAPKLTRASDAFDTAPYLTPHSDVVALLVFNHQAHATNLITRLGWQTRIAAQGGARAVYGVGDVQAAARELADYLLFGNEAALPSPVKGLSGFAGEFSARGPRDGEGRSLRDFDLTRRLFRYPCSYMIYSPAFDALPSMALAFVYERMFDVLSGKAADWDYAALPPATRRAIVEILRDTKPGLPDYFR